MPAQYYLILGIFLPLFPVDGCYANNRKIDAASYNSTHCEDRELRGLTPVILPVSRRRTAVTIRELRNAHRAREPIRICLQALAHHEWMLQLLPLQPGE